MKAKQPKKAECYNCHLEASTKNGLGQACLRLQKDDPDLLMPKDFEIVRVKPLPWWKRIHARPRLVGHASGNSKICSDGLTSKSQLREATVRLRSILERANRKGT